MYVSLGQRNLRSYIVYGFLHTLNPGLRKGICRNSLHEAATSERELQFPFHLKSTNFETDLSKLVKKNFYSRTKITL